MITFYHDTEQSFGIIVDAKACQQVVTEFLRIEKKYGISATYNVVGRIYQEQPELIDQITSGGHEIAFHSYSHTYKPENYQKEIALCRQLSPTINGYRSPKSLWNEVTLRALWQNRFLWSAENDSAREPYFIYEGLVRLPIALCDWNIHVNKMTEEQWIESFTDFMNERGYFGFGTHDCVVSLKPEARLKAYEKVIQVALRERALVVNFSEAADLFRAAALAKFRWLAAKEWNNTISEIQSEDRSPAGMKQSPLSEFRFELRNRERDAYIKWLGKYVPAPVRKIVRRLPYFKGM
jgi:hypothetical protein